MDKRTTIVTDYTVDRATLNELGFHSVIQAQLNSQSRENNQAVMDYLKRVVPRMFQVWVSVMDAAIMPIKTRNVTYSGCSISEHVITTLTIDNPAILR